MRWRWLAPAIFCLFSLANIQAQDTAGIVSFSPEGFVKNVSQVRVRFSEAMTSLGDPRDQVQPFTIDCPIKGSSKWENPTNWVYDFEKNLPGGIRAAFKLRPGLKTLTGKPVAAKDVFAFNTGGPSIGRSSPRDGADRIDEEQAFLILLDCPADEATVLNSVYFQISGIEEKVGVRIIKGQARANLLKVMRSTKGAPDNMILLLQARRRLPNEAKVELVWSKDVSSVSGLHSEQSQMLSFEVRAEFRATIECQRVNASAPCIPITPVRLDFNAPVAWSKAQQAVLKESGGKKHTPARQQYDQSADYVESVLFNWPLP